MEKAALHGKAVLPTRLLGRKPPKNWCPIARQDKKPLRPTPFSLESGLPNKNQRTQPLQRMKNDPFRKSQSIWKYLRRRSCQWVIAILLFSFSGRVFSTDYTFTATVDINPTNAVQVDADTISYSISGAPTFTLNPGDIISGQITFVGDEAIQYVNPGSALQTFALDLSSATPVNYDVQLTLTLQNVQGNLIVRNPFNISVTTLSTPNSTLAFADLGLTGFTTSEVSFTGMSYEADMISGGGSFTPSAIEMSSNGGSNNISTVPEPSTTISLTCGALFVCVRRRRTGKT